MQRIPESTQQKSNDAGTFFQVMWINKCYKPFPNGWSHVCLFPSIKCYIDLNLITEHVGSVGKTEPCLPPMAGNGNHTTYKNGHMGGMVLLSFYPHCFDVWKSWPSHRFRENVVKAS